MNDDRGSKNDTPKGVGPASQSTRPPPPPRGAGLSGTSPVGPRYAAPDSKPSMHPVKPLPQAVVRGRTQLGYELTSPAAPHGGASPDADARARDAELAVARTAVDPRAHDLQALEQRLDLHARDGRVEPHVHDVHSPRVFDPRPHEPHAHDARGFGAREPSLGAAPQSTASAAARGAFGASEPPPSAPHTSPPPPPPARPHPREPKPPAQPPLRGHEAPRTSFGMQRPEARVGSDRPRKPTPEPARAADVQRSARPGAPRAARGAESMPAGGARQAEVKPGLRLKLDGGSAYEAPAHARVPKRRAPFVLGALIVLSVFAGGVLLWLQGHGGVGAFIDKLSGRSAPVATPTRPAPAAPTNPGQTAPPGAQATPAEGTPTAQGPGTASPTTPGGAAPAAQAQPGPGTPSAPSGADNLNVATGEIETAEQAAPPAKAQTEAKPQAEPDKPKVDKPKADKPKPAAAKPAKKAAAKPAPSREPVVRIREVEADPSAILNAPPPDPSGQVTLPPPDPPAPE